MVFYSITSIPGRPFLPYDAMAVHALKETRIWKMRMRCTWWGAAEKVAVAEEEGWMNARPRADARHAACVDEKKTANIQSQQNGDI